MAAERLRRPRSRRRSTLRAERGDEATVVAGGTFLGDPPEPAAARSPTRSLSLRARARAGLRSRVETASSGSARWPRIARSSARPRCGPAGRRSPTRSRSSRARACATRRPSAACWPTPTTPRTRRRCSARSRARAVARSVRGAREIPVEELITGHYETSLEPDELITEVRRPGAPTAPCTGSSARARTRTGRASRSRRRGGTASCGSSSGRSRARRSSSRRSARSAGTAAEIGRRVRGRDRPDRGRPRLGRVPAARDRRRGAARLEELASDGLRVDGIVTGAIRYSRIDASFPGCCTRGIVRSPYPHARVVRVDASRGPGRRRRADPDDVRDLGAYGCQIARPDRARRRPRALRRRPGRRRRGRRPRAEAEEALAAGRGRVRGAAGRARPRRGAAHGSLLVHERTQVSDNDAAYFGMRPQPGTNVCHRFRIAPRRRRGAASTRRTSSSRGPTGRRPRSRPRWSRTRRSRAGTATGSRSGPGRRRRSTCARTSPGLRASRRRTCASSCRRWAARSAPRPSSGSRRSPRRSPARPGGPCSCVLPRERGVGARTAAIPRVIAVALGARADGTLVAKRGRCLAIDTGAYADCGPGRRGQKIGFSALGPYRIPNVAVESRCVYTNLPPNGAFRGYGATQAVWASERAHGRARRPARASTRSSCACATSSATATPSAPARRCTTSASPTACERAADGGRLERGSARQGALRPAEGHADAEPRGRSRSRRTRTAATRCAARRPRSARARAARSRSWRRELLGVDAWRRSASPTRTPTRCPTTRGRRRAARRT